MTHLKTFDLCQVYLCLRYIRNKTVLCSGNLNLTRPVNYKFDGFSSKLPVKLYFRGDCNFSIHMWLTRSKRFISYVNEIVVHLCDMLSSL